MKMLNQENIHGKCNKIRRSDLSKHIEYIKFSCINMCNIFFTSTVCSHILEYIVGLLNSRGNQLRARLKLALGDQFANDFYDRPIIKSLMIRKENTYLTLFGKSAIYPSYISPEMFTTAVLEVYENKKDDNGGELISAMNAENPSKEILNKKIIDWYADLNDRQNGIYTRWSMLRLFFIGGAMAAILDIDIIHVITASLDQPQNLEKAVAEINKQVITLSTQDLSAIADEQKNKIAEYISNGWSTALYPIKNERIYAWQSQPKGWDIVLKFFGWILTAFATSLGAQFWFNLMSDTLKIRAAGPKPEEKADKSLKK